MLTLNFTFVLAGLTPLPLFDLVFPELNLSPAAQYLYVKDGKQLPAFWFSRHPIAAGRLPGLTCLTCSFTCFTVWTETVTKRRQVRCCPEPLIQVLTPNP